MNRYKLTIRKLIQSHFHARLNLGRAFRLTAMCATHRGIECKSNIGVSATYCPFSRLNSQPSEYLPFTMR
jgi:hypothetical protein